MNVLLRSMLACLMVMLSVMTVQAQERTYSGTVTSADDGQPIIGANVMVAGTTTGTSTGVDGKYTIKARSGSQLVFSFLGMRSQTITVGNTTTINVSLQSDATSLEDVVVVIGLAVGAGYELPELVYLLRVAEQNQLCAAPRARDDALRLLRR